MTWQFGQIFLTDAFTFIKLQSFDYSPLAPIRVHFYLNLIAHKHTYPIQPHLSGKIRQYFLTLCLIQNSECGVGQGFCHCAHDAVICFFWHLIQCLKILTKPLYGVKSRF